jgi:hypothetical protein
MRAHAPEAYNHAKKKSKKIRAPVQESFGFKFVGFDAAQRVSGKKSKKNLNAAQFVRDFMENVVIYCMQSCKALLEKG